MTIAQMNQKLIAMLNECAVPEDGKCAVMALLSFAVEAPQALEIGEHYVFEVRLRKNQDLGSAGVYAQRMFELQCTDLGSGMRVALFKLKKADTSLLGEIKRRLSNKYHAWVSGLTPQLRFEAQQRQAAQTAAVTPSSSSPAQLTQAVIERHRHRHAGQAGLSHQPETSNAHETV